jgi:hypothetical protein
MNMSKILAALAVLVIGLGCQSNRSHTSNSVQRTASEPEVTYTVEMIPNPRLSPTSREGDTPGAVYSSNIVAVYVHHRGDSTNSNANNVQTGSK